MTPRQVVNDDATVDDSYIFLVEDRREDVELTLRAFVKAGVYNHVEVVRDGAEALEFLEGLHPSERTKGKLPALILVDINLPRMNGIQFVQHVRKLDRGQYIPIVMFTSSNEAIDLRASYDSGANSYIRKPVSSDDFGLAISRLCGYWLTVNKAASR